MKDAKYCFLLHAVNGGPPQFLQPFDFMNYNLRMMYLLLVKIAEGSLETICGLEADAAAERSNPGKHRLWTRPGLHMDKAVAVLAPATAVPSLRLHSLRMILGARNNNNFEGPLAI